ncbi:paraneoplastic antigen Ma6F-like [Saccopteryx leptura]|uniref:paraneoplastic antigen Ma6F-like n=1 Tax=Saccopteryx leptura TaxID=249018 RepID=UPI00339BBB85
MALTLLWDWCSWMGVNTQRSELILGIPDDCEDQELQETLPAALWSLSRYRVLGEEGATGEAGTPGEAAAAGEAGTADVAGAAAEEEASTQQWTWALKPVLERMTYQDLRDFSGMEEPGHEDEFFKSWLDHASDMLCLWSHISERERRRRRLVESLNGPALDLMCGPLNENPDITAQDCLAVLVQVFGNKDTRMTAQLKFMTCAQQPQETLFAYVMHPDGLLQATMEKGAIHPATADQVCNQQVLMRAVPRRYSTAS